jgi:uncharacterized membrane protein
MPAYVYYHHMGWGWGILMTLGWIVLIALFVAVVYSVIRDRRYSRGPSAREVLDRRLASGEISVEEYERTLSAMSRHEKGGGTPGPARPA